MVLFLSRCEKLNDNEYTDDLDSPWAHYIGIYMKMGLEYFSLCILLKNYPIVQLLLISHRLTRTCKILKISTKQNQKDPCFGSNETYENSLLLVFDCSTSESGWLMYCCGSRNINPTISWTGIFFIHSKTGSQGIGRCWIFPSMQNQTGLSFGSNETYETSLLLIFEHPPGESGWLMYFCCVDHSCSGSRNVNPTISCTGTCFLYTPTPFPTIFATFKQLLCPLCTMLSQIYSFSSVVQMPPSKHLPIQPLWLQLLRSKFPQITHCYCALILFIICQFRSGIPTL